MGALQNAQGSATNPRMGGDSIAQTMPIGQSKSRTGGQQTGQFSSSGANGGTSGFQSMLNTQFGTGNPFAPNGNNGQGTIDAGNRMTQQGASGAISAGNSAAGVGAGAMRGQWYGDDPIKTAQAASERSLGKNLAALRERYGAQGLGRGSDIAQAEGTAIGESATGLGDVLASRGIGARQGNINAALQGFGQQANANQGAGQLGVGMSNVGVGQGGNYNQSVNTSLNALLGAGQQNLAGRQQDLDAATALGNQGNAVTGIGVNEQGIPNAGAIAAFIASLAGGGSAGSGGGSSKSGPIA